VCIHPSWFQVKGGLGASADQVDVAPLDVWVVLRQAETAATVEDVRRDYLATLENCRPQNFGSPPWV